MSFAFPATPTIGDTYQAGNGVIYTWDGTKWTGNVGSASFVDKSGDTMSGALTIQDDLVVTGDIMERGRNVASNFDALTLNVATTGSATPTDPIGDGAGSGDAFNTLGNLFVWIANRLNVKTLTIRVAAGTHTDAGTVESPRSVNTCVIIGTGNPTIVADIFTMHNVELNALVVQTVKGVRLVGRLDIANAVSVKASNAQYVIYGSTQVAALSMTNSSHLTTTGGTAGGISLQNGGVFSIYSPTVSAIVDINCSAASGNAVFMQNSNSIFSGAILKTVGSAKNYAVSGVSFPPQGLTFQSGAKIVLNNSNLAINGYLKDPFTGIITQWGMFGGVSANIRFPMAFPNTFLVITLTSREVGFQVLKVSSASNTGFNADKYTAAGKTTNAYGYWIAIGK